MNDTNGGGVEIHTLDKFGGYVAVFNKISDVVSSTPSTQNLLDTRLTASHIPNIIQHLSTASRHTYSVHLTLHSNHVHRLLHNPRSLAAFSNNNISNSTPFSCKNSFSKHSCLSSIPTCTNTKL